MFLSIQCIIFYQNQIPQCMHVIINKILNLKKKFYHQIWLKLLKWLWKKMQNNNNDDRQITNFDSKVHMNLQLMWA